MHYTSMLNAYIRIQRYAISRANITKIIFYSMNDSTRALDANKKMRRGTKCAREQET